MGVSNTFAQLPGIVGIALTGYMLGMYLTHALVSHYCSPYITFCRADKYNSNWDIVFITLASINFASSVIYVIFASDKQIAREIQRVE